MAKRRKCVKGKLRSVNGVLVYLDNKQLEAGRDYVEEARNERINELIHRARQIESGDKSPHSKT